MCETNPFDGIPAPTELIPTATLTFAQARRTFLAIQFKVITANALTFFWDVSKM